jgi:transposase-like protein
MGTRRGYHHHARVGRLVCWATHRRLWKLFERGPHGHKQYFCRICGRTFNYDKEP